MEDKPLVANSNSAFVENKFHYKAFANAKCLFWKKSDLYKGMNYASWNMLICSFLLQTAAGLSDDFDKFIQSKKSMLILAPFYFITTLIVGLFGPKIARKTTSCRNKQDLEDCDIEYLEPTEIAFIAEIKKNAGSENILSQIAQEKSAAKDLVLKRQALINFLPLSFVVLCLHIAYLGCVLADDKESSENYYVNNFDTILFAVSFLVEGLAWLVSGCVKNNEKSVRDNVSAVRL